VNWKEVVGQSDKMLSIASRFADLLVLAQSDDKSSDALLDAVDMAIFESGRPVVFVPSGVSSAIGNRIMIAWNGSTQAALAVTAALPLLHLAGQVDIVQAGDIDKAVSANELALYLALHGIKTQNHAIDVGIRDIGGTLIAAAERFESDLIVMGAYGHSRFRERILGGATRGLLKDSPWPILMMH
jgi:nucleotide-binding universal stress UspA family protein